MRQLKRGVWYDDHMMMTVSQVLVLSSLAILSASGLRLGSPEEKNGAKPLGGLDYDDGEDVEVGIEIKGDSFISKQMSKSRAKLEEMKVSAEDYKVATELAFVTQSAIASALKEGGDGPMAAPLRKRWRKAVGQLQKTVPEGHKAELGQIFEALKNLDVLELLGGEEDGQTELEEQAADDESTEMLQAQIGSGGGSNDEFDGEDSEGKSLDVVAKASLSNWFTPQTHHVGFAVYSGLSICANNNINRNCSVHFFCGTASKTIDSSFNGATYNMYFNILADLGKMNVQNGIPAGQYINVGADSASGPLSGQGLTYSFTAGSGSAYTGPLQPGDQWMTANYGGFYERSRTFVKWADFEIEMTSDCRVKLQDEGLEDWYQETFGYLIYNTGYPTELAAGNLQDSAGNGMYYTVMTGVPKRDDPSTYSQPSNAAGGGTVLACSFLAQAHCQSQSNCYSFVIKYSGNSYTADGKTSWGKIRFMEKKATETGNDAFCGAPTVDGAGVTQYATPTSGDTYWTFCNNGNWGGGQSGCIWRQAIRSDYKLTEGGEWADAISGARVELNKLFSEIRSGAASKTRVERIWKKYPATNVWSCMNKRLISDDNNLGGNKIHEVAYTNDIRTFNRQKSLCDAITSKPITPKFGDDYPGNVRPLSAWPTKGDFTTPNGNQDLGAGSDNTGHYSDAIAVMNLEHIIWGHAYFNNASATAGGVGYNASKGTAHGVGYDNVMIFAKMACEQWNRNYADLDKADRAAFFDEALFIVERSTSDCRTQTYGASQTVPACNGDQNSANYADGWGCGSNLVRSNSNTGTLNWNPRMVKRTRRALYTKHKKCMGVGVREPNRYMEFDKQATEDGEGVNLLSNCGEMKNLQYEYDTRAYMQTDREMTPVMQVMRRTQKAVQQIERVAKLKIKNKTFKRFLKRRPRVVFKNRRVRFSGRRR